MTRRIFSLGLVGLALLTSAPSLLADPFPSITEEQLIGTWSCQQKDTRQVITFTKDHEFKGRCFVTHTLSFEYAGKWRLGRDYPYHFNFPRLRADEQPIEGPDRWFIHYTYTQCPGLEPGTKDVDYATAFDDGTMGIITFKGALRYYQRVQDKPAP